MRLLLVLILGIFWSVQAATAQKSTIPNVSLEITVQQKENGKLSDGYHLLHLLCWQGSCSLTSNTLNQCMEASSGNKAFCPKVERSSTNEGNLKVISVNYGELEVRESGVAAETVYQFRFEADPKSRMSTRITSFSGGFVKNSAILNKILTVEYVPLRQSFNEVKLDCSALLPGLSKPSK